MSQFHKADFDALTADFERAESRRTPAKTLKQAGAEILAVPLPASPKALPPRSHYYPVGAVVTVRQCEPGEIFVVTRISREGYWVKSIESQDLPGEMLVSRGDADAYREPEEGPTGQDPDEYTDRVGHGFGIHEGEDE